MSVFAVCYISLLFSLLVPASASPETAIEHCEQLQKQDNTTGRIAVIGLLQTRLLLIREDAFVYNLPPKRLVAGLVLNSSTPFQLQQKWPVLGSPLSFNRSVTIQSEDDQQLLLLNGQLRQRGLECSIFSLTTGATESKLFEYSNTSIGQLSGHWLSSAEVNRFFVFDAHLQTLSKFVLNFNTSTVQPDGVPLRMCKQSDTFRGREQLILHTEKCNYPLNWSLGSASRGTGGFTDSKWFVLLGEHLVYIFDAIAVARPGTVVQVTALNYTQFIICPQPDLERLQRMHKAIALVGILLLFVIIISMATLHVYLLQKGAFQQTPSLMKKSTQNIKTTGTKGSSQTRLKTNDCKQCKDIIKVKTRTLPVPPSKEQESFKQF